MLCPHCNQSYISQERLDKYGKCMSCARRETIAKTHNREYIKFIDLPESEQQRLIKQREVNNSYNTKRVERSNKEKQVKELTVKKTDEVIGGKGHVIYTPTMIKSVEDFAKQGLFLKEILEKMLLEYPNAPLTYGNLTKLISRYKIPHVASKRGRARKEDSEEIEEVLNTIQEPVLDETNNVEVNSNTDENYETINEDNNSNVDVIEETKLEDSQLLLDNVDDNRLGDLPNRFNPIIDEVFGVTDKRFKEEDCYVEEKYKTQDYIDIVNSIKSLNTTNISSNNIADIVRVFSELVNIIDTSSEISRKRKSQLNILNAYQSDALHESENEIAEDGDTYYSDKMHVIRKYRRYCELDGKNALLFNVFKNSTNSQAISNYKDACAKLQTAIIELKNSLCSDEQLDKVLSYLNKNKCYVESPVFTPMVDTTMSSKYNWVKPMTNSSAKSMVSVTRYNPTNFRRDNNRPITRVGFAPNTPPTNMLTARVRKSLKKFRVSCKISGGGYGAYQTWYRDYECTNSDTALAYAKNTLKQISENRKGVMYTDLDIIELPTNN